MLEGAGMIFQMKDGMKRWVEVEVEASVLW